MTIQSAFYKFPSSPTQDRGENYLLLSSIVYIEGMQNMTSHVLRCNVIKYVHTDLV